MARIARILVADCDLDCLNLVSDRLRTRGYINLLEMVGENAIARAKSERPDIIILGSGFSDPSTEQIVTRLKAEPETQRIPVIMIDKDTGGTALTETLARHVEGYLLSPFSDDELFAHIGAAQRLEIMESELVIRSETMRDFGIEDYGVEARNQSGDSPKIMLVSPDGPGEYTSAMENYAELDTTESFAGAGQYLADHNFEAAVIDCGKIPEAALVACEDIRRIPTLYHMPLLMVCPPDAFDDAALPYRRGASGVLTKPFVDAQLRARLSIMVRQERLRRGILEACRHSGRDETNDPLTGVFSEDFLHKHLGNLVQGAFRWDKNLSLTVIYMPEIHSVRVEYGDRAADALFRQVANAVSRLVRGEDLCARLGETGFCVVLPESTLEATSIIMHRLASVVRHSEFSLPEVNRPVSVKPRLASAEYKPGDTPMALLGRALVAAAAEEAA